MTDYLTVETIEHLTVDPDAQTKLRIDFDVALFRLPCSSSYFVFCPVLSAAEMEVLKLGQSETRFFFLKLCVVCSCTIDFTCSGVSGRNGYIG